MSCQVAVMWRNLLVEISEYFSAFLAIVTDPRGGLFPVVECRSEAEEAAEEERKEADGQAEVGEEDSKTMDLQKGWKVRRACALVIKITHSN